ncbi:AMED_5909 family protein [Amycolatopsis sp. cmx-11-12]|uniref:AMED_5909 family protein n=1 Tax=Amycolatopsis sp. cmx-11-12 TaxID=2785795 RepID=UPI00391805FC
MSKEKVSHGPDFPRTLLEARGDMVMRTPSGEDDSVDWVKYHRHNVTMFQAVAVSDPDHKWECLAWADIERRRVEEFTNRPEWRQADDGPSEVVL